MYGQLSHDAYLIKKNEYTICSHPRYSRAKFNYGKLKIKIKL